MWPDRTTVLAWYRKLVARKFDGSKARRSPGRPRIKPEVEQLIVRIAQENHDWGYDRIVGALANLGYKVCDQTVGNVLQRHALPPAPERKRTTTWAALIRIDLALLAGDRLLHRGGADAARAGDLLFFIHLESRRVDIGGITVDPDERWNSADRSQRDHGGMRRAPRLSLSAARSRQQVQPVLPSDHCVRRRRARLCYRRAVRT